MILVFRKYDILLKPDLSVALFRTQQTEWADNGTVNLLVSKQ